MPPYLTSPAVLAPEWADGPGGLALLLGPDRRPRHAARRGGLAREADLPLGDRLRDEFARHLVVLAGPGPAVPAPAAPHAWAVQWAAERARAHLLAGRWAAAGGQLDAAWLAARALLPAPCPVDPLYAALRSAGAWGGSFGPWGGVLLAPPDKHPALAAALAAHPGWGVCP